MAQAKAIESNMVEEGSTLAFHRSCAIHEDVIGDGRKSDAFIKFKTFLKNYSKWHVRTCSTHCQPLETCLAHTITIICKYSNYMQTFFSACRNDVSWRVHGTFHHWLIAVTMISCFAHKAPRVYDDVSRSCYIWYTHLIQWNLQGTVFGYYDIQPVASNIHNPLRIPKASMQL